MTVNLTGVDFGGQVSAHSLLANALGRADGFARVIVVVLDDDGDILTGWSKGELLEALGMLTVAQRRMLVEFGE